MTTDMFIEAVKEISERTGVEPTFRGGGRGQVAELDLAKWGLLFTGKGTSKYAAVVDLLEQVRTALLNMEKARIAADLDLGPEDGDEGTEGWDEEREHIEEGMAPEDVETLERPERATVEDALAVLGLVFPDLEVYEEDDDRTPGPVWKEVDGVPTLVSIIPCVGECMQGQSDICDCRCMGANHGLMKIGELGTPTWAEVLALQPVRFGPKDCACGCGTRTDRRFAPGHDARFHAAQKREQERTALGLSEEEYADHLKVRARDKAKARRKARRERRAMTVGASEATDA